MKFLMIAMFFLTSAFAVEVATDCPAMNHSREKIVKDSSAKKQKNSGQVISQ